MFRRLTMAIFRLYIKYLVSSYTRLIMGCIHWFSAGGEVGTRSRTCRGGWEVQHTTQRNQKSNIKPSTSILPYATLY